MPTDNNEILLGRHCFLVRATALPAGFNQRPGVTLLLARDEPLEVEIAGFGVLRASAILLPPEARRRFVSQQPHYSITLEPAHRGYLGFLAWARESAARPIKLGLASKTAAGLETLSTQAEFDNWLFALLAAEVNELTAPPPRLQSLLGLVDATAEDASAEQIWSAFRKLHPGSQAHYSHWLQETIGLSLRKWLLWRKLRRAMDGLGAGADITTVAHASGFADSAHLSRICARTFGLRPSDANNRKILQVTALSAD